MSLTEYFLTTEGVGVLGTADVEGNVDMAVYARPHVYFAVDSVRPLVGG
jgi:hypothetical protein